jgi:hypothetical protein
MRHEEPDPSANLRVILGSLRRRWWLYLIALLVSGASAFAIAREYGSTKYTVAGILVQNDLPIPRELPFRTDSDLLDALRYARSTEVLGRVREDLVAAGGSDLDVKHDRNTAMLNFSMACTDPVKGAEALDLVMRKTIDYAEEIRASGAEVVRGEFELKKTAHEQSIREEADFLQDLEGERRTNLAKGSNGDTSLEQIPILKARVDDMNDELELSKLRFDQLKNEVEASLRGLASTQVTFRRQQIENFKAQPWDRDRADRVAALAKSFEELAKQADQLDQEGYYAWVQSLQLACDGVLDPPSQATYALISDREQDWRKNMSDLAAEGQRIVELESRIGKARERLDAFTSTSASIDLTAQGNDSWTAELEADRIRHKIEASEGAIREIDQQLSDIATYNKLFDGSKGLREFSVFRAPTAEGAVSDSNHATIGALVFLGFGMLLCGPFLLTDLARHRDDISTWADRAGLPVLTVPVNPHRPTQRRLTAGSIDADHSHELRLLALRIQQSMPRPTGSIVLFSSLEDRTTLPLIERLAGCFARRQERVLVVDLESPFMPARQRDFDTVVDTSSAEGKKKKDKRSAKAESALATRRMDEITSVSDFLSGLGESEAWSLQCEPLREDVDVLPWGNATLPPEAFASRRLTDLLDQCRKRYSLILVAGPPISHFADLQMVTARCDGLILQCGASAQAKRYEHYVRELAELEAPLLGIVA